MERDHLEDQGMNGRIILKEISNIYKGKFWTGFFWLKIGETGRLW